MNLLEIKSALAYGTAMNGGSMALFQEGRDKRKWEQIKKVHKDMMEEVLAEAEKYLKYPIRSLPFSLHRLYEENGSRKEYEAEYFERRGRLNTFAIAAIAYGTKEYVQALEDTIWAICDEYSWCLPAHMANSSMKIIEHLNNNQSKNTETYIREHDRMIDLFAAETGFALAEILAMLEDKLAPLVVYRAKKLIKYRVLEPYCELNAFFDWEVITNNWAAVCAGSVGAAALYLIEDDNMLAPVLRKVLDSMECFLSGYLEDGACMEGLGYWNYGFGFFVSFSELLNQRTHGKIDLMQKDKVKEIALFQQKCYLVENAVVSFSDGSLKSNFIPGLTCYLKKRFNEVEIPEKKYRMRFTDDSCYRWTHNVRNFVWTDEDYLETPLKDEVYYLKDAQWFSTRKVLDGIVACFAAKGGHNDEPHNHNDVGNFILNINGETLLADTGAGEYVKQYFGPERYTFFCNSSRGHSVPIVDGTWQEAGREHFAEVIEMKTSEAEDIFALDIARAYNLDYLKKLSRNFCFKKDGEIKIILTDEYEFTKFPGSVTERFVTFNKPQITGAGEVRISGKMGTAIIHYNPEELECVLGKDVFVNHQAIAEDVFTVDFHLKKLDLKVSADLVFYLVNS